MVGIMEAHNLDEAERKLNYPKHALVEERGT